MRSRRGRTGSNGPSHAPSKSIQLADLVPQTEVFHGTADRLRTDLHLSHNPRRIILLVNIHDSRASDIIIQDRLTAEPSIPISGYRDAFGNQCHRVLAPAGRLRLTADGVISDSGLAGRSDTRCQAGPHRGPARRDPRIPVGKPLLRNRSAVCRPRGSSSAAPLRAIRACRPSAITFITTSPSTTRTLAPPAAPPRPSTNAPASAATTRTSPSPSAAA